MDKRQLLIEALKESVRLRRELLEHVTEPDFVDRWCKVRTWELEHVEPLMKLNADNAALPDL